MENDHKAEHENSRTKLLVNITSWVLLALCVAFGIVLWRKGAFSSVEALQAVMDSYGSAGPLLFILLQIVQVVIPVLPGGVSCMAGVLMFGPWGGFFYSYAGLVIGSLFAFALARNLGKPLLKKLFSKKLHEKYEKWTTYDSKRFDRLFAVAIFLPGLPDDFLCFLAGTTGMTWKKFIIITLTCRPIMLVAYSLGVNAVIPLLGA